MLWLIWTVLGLIFWFWVIYIVVGLVAGSIMAICEHWRKVLLFLSVFVAIPVIAGGVVWLAR